MAKTFPTVGSNAAWQQSWLDARKDNQTLNPTGTGGTKGVLPVNQSLANAYAANNPTWQPPPEINAQLSSPITAAAPVKPTAADMAYGDPTIASQIAAQNAGLADTYTGLGVSFDANGTPIYSGGSYLQGAQNYGIDENGNLIAQGDTRFNPFSEAELMKTAFEHRKNGTRNSYAAMGQLYSGARNNAQTTDATNYAANYNALVRNAEGYYSGLVSKAVGARDTNAINDAGLQGQAVSNYTAAHANDQAPIVASSTLVTPPRRRRFFSRGTT